MDMFLDMFDDVFCFDLTNPSLFLMFQDQIIDLPDNLANPSLLKPLPPN